MNSDIQIVGIDCAVDSKNVGVALASSRTVERVFANVKNPVSQIVEWLDPDRRALVVLDAPLGWPAALKSELPNHRPGESWDSSPDKLFRRATDELVQEHYRRPLDVGADRIARTAYAALQMLSRLRGLTGRSLPMVWSSSGFSGDGVIEVYPAATLIAHDVKAKGYKHWEEAEQIREKIAENLKENLSFSVDDQLLLSNDDALDAVVCILASIEFLNGNCWPPGDLMSKAKSEGWIWVRRPSGE